MRRSLCAVSALTVILALGALPNATAQAKPEAPGLERLEGTIESLNANDSTLVIRQSNRLAVNFTIVWDKGTAVTYRNAAATADELKPGRRVIALGTFDQPKGTRMSAKRIDVRTGK